MKWGIIGTGNMGSMLTSALINSGAIHSNQLTIFNRTPEKAEKLAETFTDLRTASSLKEIQQKSDILFICVKPHHYSDILNELKDNFTEGQCIVSITSPISVEELEKATPCQVARIVPSITNHAFAGVSLFTFGSRISEQYKQTLKNTFSYFSEPVEVEEAHIRVASDIVSCGPAFISFLLRNWIQAAEDVAGINEDQATKLTENMMIGLGKLFAKKIFTLEELMAKVTVKGGVTGEGLQALEDHTGELFHEMFKATQRKHKEDKESIDL
ncbi:late competence protein ComER [Halobacillus yeomjeoni]|uniref:Pyrroline-5-carboxylate reductase n=1 Tax=Halobacillus yeomjeoni TaxID=311194 RepID=A0A931HUZ8_9BACI|nr:late competence protein ComER [Halobacillus yeomjeoni]MBH0229939.1 late competence protein ComER [Halobacillus yeomjeoni]